MIARLGIIGAGQLGGYLCQAASKLGLRTSVLASSREDVAVPFADSVFYGTSADLGLLDRFAVQCDVITFEHENVPEAALNYLQAVASKRNLTIAPDVPVMRLLQNKALQKQWLLDMGLPTAPFRAFDRGLSGAPTGEFAGSRFVVKSQRGGYDGLGVAVVHDGRWPARFDHAPCIVEALVENKREIAVLVARNAGGRTVAYPAFSTAFDHAGNVLRQVACPAGIDISTERAAVDLGLSVVNRLQGVGVFAIELFLTGDGLLINEISPRVHNAGHLTLEANHTSQFEQHIRAVTDMALASALPIHPAAVMNNLLYEPRVAEIWLARSKSQGKARMMRLTPTPEDDVHVHWYGKSRPRRLRKMGHVTAVGESVELAARKADQTIDEMCGL